MIRSWFALVTAGNSILNIEYSMVVPGGPGSRRPYATANSELLAPDPSWRSRQAVRVESTPPHYGPSAGIFRGQHTFPESA